MRFRVFRGQPIPVSAVGAAIVTTYDVDEAARLTGWDRQSLVAVYEGTFPPDDGAEAVAGGFGRQAVGLSVAGVVDDPRRAAEWVDDATPESEAALIRELMRTTDLDRDGATAEVLRLVRAMPRTAAAGYPGFAAAVMRAVGLGAG